MSLLIENFFFPGMYQKRSRKSQLQRQKDYKQLLSVLQLHWKLWKAHIWERYIFNNASFVVVHSVRQDKKSYSLEFEVCIITRKTFRIFHFKVKLYSSSSYFFTRHILRRVLYNLTKGSARFLLVNVCLYLNGFIWTETFPFSPTLF